MRHDEKVLGTVNLTRGWADAFDDEAERLGLVVAAEVATAIVKSKVYEAARTARQVLQEERDAAADVAMARG